MNKIKKQKLHFLLFLILNTVFFSNVGCVPKLLIRSDPSEAQVAINLPNGIKKEIGTTPFELAFSELENAIPLSATTGEMIPILFEKKDHESLLVMVPAARFGLSSASVLVKLTSNQKATDTATQLLQSLHNAQKFVNAGNLQKAIEEIDKTLDKNPMFIRAISMKASIYYIQKKWDESQIWYEKALSLDNGFEEAIRMISEIKRQRGDS